MLHVLRRGTQQQAPACCLPGGPLSPWDALRHALSTLALSPEAGSRALGAQGHYGAASGSAAVTAAAAAAAKQQRAISNSSSAVLAEERGPALRLRQQMQGALQRGEYGQVLQLLWRGEREAEAAAAAAAAAGRCSTRDDTPAVATAAAAAWHPLDRAELFDCALRVCALRADADEARRLVGLMWRRQLPVGIVANTSLLRALCAVGRQADALQHLRSIPTKRQRTQMYTLLLRSCNEAGALEVGRGCYALFQRRQHTPDAQLMAEVVKLLGASGDAAGAEAAWQQALVVAAEASDAAGAGSGSCSGGGSGGVPSAEEACLHAARAEGLAKAGHLEAAVAAVEVMLDSFSDLLPLPLDASLTSSSSSGSSSSSSGVVAAERAAGDDVGGGQQQRRQRPHPRASHVQYMQEARNAVLAAAQAAGDQATAKRVASLATLRGLPPDVGTYNILLRGSLEHGDGLAALQDGVEELRLLSMQPNRETYALLLKACAAEHDTAAAQAVFDGMADDGVAPSRLLHNALLAAYAAAGDLEGIDAAYWRMREGGFAPDGYTFRLLLDAIKSWSDLEAGGRATSEESTPLASNERTHHRQMAAAKLAGWVGELDSRWAGLLCPSLFAALLHAYSHSGQIYPVLLLMRDAFGCQLSPETTSVIGGSGSAAAAAAAAGLQDLEAALLGSSSSTGSASTSNDGDARAAVGSPSSEASSSSSNSDDGGMPGPLSKRTLERAHLAPSLPIFNAAIAACTRVGHRHMADAVALLSSMLAAELAPDAHTYTSLISGCAYGRQAGLARELLRHMQRRGVQPTLWTHNAMLKVECWTYGVDAGVVMMRGMQARGVQPDRASWSTLLSAAKHARRGDVAATAWAHLSGQIQREEEEAAAEAARQEEEAVAAGAQPPDDHRWHGYYDQQNQEDEDEW